LSNNIYEVFGAVESFQLKFFWLLLRIYVIYKKSCPKIRIKYFSCIKM